MEAPNDFKQAIVNGEVAEAIQLLYQLVEERGDREIEHQLIIINFDFQEYERGIKNGLISPDRSREVYNQINNSLLGLYEELSATKPTDRVEPIPPVDEDFKAAILAGKIDSAIQMLEQEIEARGDQEAEKSLLLIQANSLEVKRDTIGALSSEDKLRIRKNQVVKSLLGLREEIYANRKEDTQNAPRKVNRTFKRLLAKGELSKAIKWLETATEGNKNSGLRDNLVFLQKQVAELRRHQNLATLSPEELRLGKNRLISSLWDLYQELEETKESTSTEEVNGPSKDRSIKKWSLEGELLSGFGSFKKSITSLSVAGDLVLSTDSRRGYNIYDLGESVLTRGRPNITAITATFLPRGINKGPSKSGNYLIGDQAGVIRTFNAQGEMIVENDLKAGPIKTLACSPDGDKLLVGTNDRAGLYTMEGRALRILGESGELARTGPFGQENDDATPFLQLLPPGVRLTSLVVSDGSLVDSIRINYREGKEAGALIIGETKGKANEEFYVNSPISKITGRAGEDLDQLQFHFEDGTKTPVYGGDGGEPFEVMFEDVDFAGFHGQASSRGWVSQLGFFGRLKPEEPVRKAKRKV